MFRPVLFTIMVNDISPIFEGNLIIKFSDDITRSVPVGLNSQQGLVTSKGGHR